MFKLYKCICDNLYIAITLTSGVCEYYMIIPHAFCNLTGNNFYELLHYNIVSNFVGNALTAYIRF